MSTDGPKTKTVFDKHPSTSSFLESFSKLYQFMKTDTFTDVEFSVQGKRFTAHKPVISAHSPVFEAMFSNPMLEASSGRVVIDDVKPKVFEAFLHYLYTGIEPKTDATTAAELFVCADKYGVNSLVITCEKVLCKKMGPNNVIGVYLMAEAYRRPVLRKRAYQIMGLYMADIVKTKEWDLIKEDADRLKTILAFLKDRRERLCEGPLSSVISRLRNTVSSQRSGGLTKTVVKIDWDNERHLRPQDFKIEMPAELHGRTLYDPPASNERSVHLYGYNYFIEDKLDGGRIVMAVGFVKRSTWRDEKYNRKIDILCEVSVSTQDDPDDVIDAQKSLIHWANESVHPTMGSPRYVVYEENAVRLPRTGVIFFEIIFKVDAFLVDLDGYLYQIKRETSPGGPETDSIQPKRYVFDDGRQFETPSNMDNCVRIRGANCEWNVPLERLGRRTRTLFGPERHFKVSDTPKDTLDRLVRYMYLGESSIGLPPRDTVDLSMLKAACTLRMDYDLILYLEHALAWGLDNENCLDLIEAGTELGLGFLKHGALLYFKIHSDRILQQFPDNWDRIRPSLLTEILLDMNWNAVCGKVCFLPAFLTKKDRKPDIQQNDSADKKM